METAALPDGSQEWAVNARRGRSSSARITDLVTRSSSRLEKTQATAIEALEAVASYLDADEDPSAFFGRLGETLAGLVGARRIAFWRLGARGTLVLQPTAFGFEPGSPVGQARLEVGAPGSALERILSDEIVLDGGTVPELDTLWRSVGLVGMRSSIATSWRAGQRVIGIVAAYDSRHGFSANDVWLLRLAAMSTGLLWQYKEAEDDLGATAVRLEEAVAARKRLVNNIGAGGDEARRRFASVLHDDSLQLLTGASLHVERIRAESQGTHQAVQLDHLRTTLLKLEDSLRRLLINVSTEEEVDLDLDEAISERLEALRIQSGIEAHVDLNLADGISAPVQALVLKNVSEALTNVEKHGHATRVLVAAESVDGGIRVEVVDDGTGFVISESMRGHVGLISMKERAQLAGGWFVVKSEPGAGSRVEFWIPKSL